MYHGTGASASRVAETPERSGGTWSSRAGGGRGDDERFVAAADEMPGRPEGAVGHAVDIGREGFGDDGTQIRMAATPGVTGPTSILPPGNVL